MQTAYNPRSARIRAPVLIWLVSSWRSMFRVAFLAVDGAAFCGLEWNFAFVSTVRAGSLVHLSGATVETAPISITHFFRSFSLVYTQNASDSILSILLPRLACLLLNLCTRAVNAVFHQHEPGF